MKWEHRGTLETVGEDVCVGDGVRVKEDVHVREDVRIEEDVRFWGKLRGTDDGALGRDQGPATGGDIIEEVGC